MAIVVVQTASGSWSGTAGSSAQTATFGSAVTAGNTVIALLACDSTGTYSSGCSDNKSNSYTKRSGTLTSGAGASIYSSVVSTGGSSFTVSMTTTTGANAFAQFVIMEVSGLSGFDTQATDKGTSRTTLSATTATLASANELIVAVSTTNNAPTFSTNQSGFTNVLSDTNYSICPISVDYKTVAATTAVTVTNSCTVSGTMHLCVAAFTGTADDASVHITEYDAADAAIFAVFEQAVYNAVTDQTNYNRAIIGDLAVTDGTPYSKIELGETSTWPEWIAANENAVQDQGWVQPIGPDLAGTTYNDTLSEAGSSADTINHTVTATNALSETASAADTVSAVQVFASSLSEAATATDTVSAAQVFASALTESGAAADTPAATVSTADMAVTESGAASDTVVGTFSSAAMAVAEAGSAVDTPAATLVAVGSVSESGTAADTLGGTFSTANMAVTEAGSAVDTPAGTFVSANMSVGETANAVDTTTGGLLYSDGTTEAVSASDTVSAALTMAASVTEAGSVADTPAAVLVAVGTVSEAGAAVDTTAATFVSASMLVSETGTAVDTTDYQANQVYNVSVSEAASAIDTLTVTGGQDTASRRDGGSGLHEDEHGHVGASPYDYRRKAKDAKSEKPKKPTIAEVKAVYSEVRQQIGVLDAPLIAIVGPFVKPAEQPSADVVVAPKPAKIVWREFVNDMHAVMELRALRQRIFEEQDEDDVEFLLLHAA